MDELRKQLEQWLAPLFLVGRSLIEEDTPSLDQLVNMVRGALDHLRWKMVSEVDFYIAEIRTDYVIIMRWPEDIAVTLYYRVPYTYNADTGEVLFGEFEQIERVSEYRTLDGQTLEEMAARVRKELEQGQPPWPAGAVQGGQALLLLEGWLPSGMTQNDLDDSDFAWLSNAYKKATATEKAKMNKRDSRKLPYKVHGKVDRDGWKAAWQAAAHGGARAMKSYAGGPSRDEVIARLKRDKPKGITINKDNTIGDGGTEENLTPRPSPLRGGENRTRASGGKTLLLTVEDVPVIEETGTDANGRRYLVYRGTALVDNVVSGNGRFYSAEANDRIMQATNQYMEEGGIVTVYSRHGKAVPGPLGELPTGLPVGKVIKSLWREGNRIRYEARISDTEEGRDVMVLLEDQVIKFSSIRSTDFKTVRKKVNGQEVDAVVEATIKGIDLAETAGIAGAEIDEILTEELEIEDISTREEDNPMDWKTVTLEELRKERPDLVEAILKGMQLAEEVTSLKAQVGGLGAKVQTAEAALAQAKTEHDAKIKSLTEEKDAKIAALTEEVGKSKVEAAIAKAVEGKEHAAKLRQHLTFGFVLVEEKDGKKGEVFYAPAKTEAEVAERLPKAEAAVKALVEEFSKDQARDSFRGSLNTQGQTGTEEVPAGDEPGPLAEESMANIKRLAAG